ncbi:hypothetical protein B0I31_101853 [Saccharothrix carnea]|uniref:Uncharacterized protein n=1 Tax=Saccharothrix carnea TaxID=1280637 RepID=A0A2P8IJH2_SACCR|nr:hypothetical protein [Saccharothrix carnea]PSL58632.1 hypothetical protein B0I31_101853 [Saccharothrix carnea]
MTHPHPGQQPGPQQYPCRPHPGQPPYQGQQPHPGQPYPGQPYPGQPYPGQPPVGYPGGPQAHPGGPKPPSKAFAVVSALLFLPNVILLYVVSMPFVADGRPSPHFWVSLIGVPLSEEVTGNVDFAVSVSLTVASVVLVLAVLLACRVPGVRWALLGIALVAVANYVYVVIDILANIPGEFVVLPAIALLLWLVSGLVAALPPVGRAMRGAKPRTPGHQVAGPPPPQGQWG